MKAAALALAMALCASGQKRADWVQLRGYNYKTGRINADARSLDRAEVAMVGYMVPFDDDQSTTVEFLLVPHYGQCIHTPPPPPNQMVLVRMEAGRRARVVWDKPVSVSGRMFVEEGKGALGRPLYRMVGTRVDEVTGY
ncbi:MAG: DUF3299 domain-containing protein [Acidobacteria bacterium]|nr:DUF3299 domain-containing protein [Acidobacteriota bacterium]